MVLYFQIRSLGQEIGEENHPGETNKPGVDLFRQWCDCLNPPAAMLTRPLSWELLSQIFQERKLKWKEQKMLLVYHGLQVVLTPFPSVHKKVEFPPYPRRRGVTPDLHRVHETGHECQPSASLNACNPVSQHCNCVFCHTQI